MKNNIKYIVIVLMLLLLEKNLYSQIWYDVQIYNDLATSKLILTINNNSNENIVISDNPFRIYCDNLNSLLYPFLPKMKYQPNTVYFYKDSLFFINTGVIDFNTINFTKLIRIGIFRKKVVVFYLPYFIDQTYLSQNYFLSFIMFAKERDILNNIYSTKKEVRDSLIIYYESLLSLEDTMFVSKSLINNEMEITEKPNEFLLNYLNQIIFDSYNGFVWDSYVIEHLKRVKIYKEM